MQTNIPKTFERKYDEKGKDRRPSVQINQRAAIA
jgi:hypothetical protein